jgi:hypothetical protein
MNGDEGEQAPQTVLERVDVKLTKSWWVAGMWAGGKSQAQSPARLGRLQFSK